MKPGTAWFPLYIDDYQRDTLGLSRDEHGGYFLLMLAYYGRGGPLEDDDHELAVITKCTPAQWRKLRPRMAKFFRIEDGVWRHKRIDCELGTRATRHAERSATGRQGNQQRWKNSRNGHVDGGDGQSDNETSEMEEEKQTESTKGPSLSDTLAISSAIAEQPSSDRSTIHNLHLEESSSPPRGKEEDLLGAEGVSLARADAPRDTPPLTQEQEASGALETPEAYAARRAAENEKLKAQAENLRQQAEWEEAERQREHRKNAEMIRQVQIEAAKRKLLYDLPTPKADA